jgi:hypothetical protein
MKWKDIIIKNWSQKFTSWLMSCNFGEDFNSKIVNVYFCHNPNLGLATKARACKVASQKGSLGVTFHAPGSAKECEGMNPRTPK